MIVQKNVGCWKSVDENVKTIHTTTVVFWNNPNLNNLKQQITVVYKINYISQKYSLKITTKST